MDSDEAVKRTSMSPDSDARFILGGFGKRERAKSV